MSEAAAARVREIVETISQQTGVPVAVICSRDRAPGASVARRRAMKLARAEMVPARTIAAVIGCSSHRVRQAWGEADGDQLAGTAAVLRIAEEVAAERGVPLAQICNSTNRAAAVVDARRIVMRRATALPARPSVIGRALGISQQSVSKALEPQHRVRPVTRAALEPFMRRGVPVPLTLQDYAHRAGMTLDDAKLAVTRLVRAGAVKVCCGVPAIYEVTA